MMSIRGCRDWDPNVGLVNARTVAEKLWRKGSIVEMRVHAVAMSMFTVVLRIEMVQTSGDAD